MAIAQISQVIMTEPTAAMNSSADMASFRIYLFLTIYKLKTLLTQYGDNPNGLEYRRIAVLISILMFVRVKGLLEWYSPRQVFKIRV